MLSTSLSCKARATQASDSIDCDSPAVSLFTAIHGQTELQKPRFLGLRRDVDLCEVPMQAQRALVRIESCRATFGDRPYEALPFASLTAHRTGRPRRMRE